jgi:hypothetical protein
MEQKLSSVHRLANRSNDFLVSAKVKIFLWRSTADFISDKRFQG